MVEKQKIEKIPVYAQTGEQTGELVLNQSLFGITPKESVVHQVAVAYLANRRTVIADTKDKGEIRGGGRKPWRQKGTGRARHGSIRSPLWRGGGVIFGPTTERNYSQKVNKKMKRKALLMCLTDKVENQELTVLQDLKIEFGKSKELVAVIKNFKKQLGLSVKRKKITKSTKKDTVVTKETGIDTEEQTKKFDLNDYRLSLLIVIPKAEQKLFQAGRNIPGLKIITAESLNVMELLKYKKLFLSLGAVEILEKTFLKR